MKHFNVLVFPGGSEIGLEINRALRLCKEVTLFSAGMDISNHAPFVFSRHFIVPSVNQSDWVDRLNAIIVENKIEYIFPAYDEVHIALMKNAAEIKAKIVSSPLQTCLITRSKTATYQHFKEILPTPFVYENADEIREYPVFVKPDKGQGSEGAMSVKNREELDTALSGGKKVVVMEFLAGEEFTIDCFSHRKMGLLFCEGRRRIRTRSGISVASEFFSCNLFSEYANKILENIKLYGAWFFQLKQDAAGVYKLLEIGPRIAGAMAYHRVLGVNFPLLSLYEQEEIPVTIKTNPCHLRMDRALTNRYVHSIAYDIVYVDLDDTLILDGSVNVELVRFLYQCLNQQKKLKLLTRHEKDVVQTLKKYRLNGLFDDVIHLKRDEPKSSAIREGRAILIDDSFSERTEVGLHCGIPTFDNSMIEMLIDERR